MLDQIFASRLAQLLSSTNEGRNDAFPSVLRTIRHDMARRGTVHSSVHVAAVRDAYVAELDWHALNALECARRVQSSLRAQPTQGFRVGLQEALYEELAHWAHILGVGLQGDVSNLPRMGMNISLQDAFVRSTNWLRVETDLFVDGIVNTPADERASQQYNFYSAVASVQTGSHANATITQSLGSSELAAIVEALGAVQRAISEAPHFQVTTKQELMQIAEDCIREVRTQTPNGTRLAALFNVLGTSIQSIAAAQPAYNALRMALLPFGIMLP